MVEDHGEQLLLRGCKTSWSFIVHLAGHEMWGREHMCASHMGKWWQPLGSICFDNLMISLFRQLCDSLCPVVRSSSLPMEGGQLLLAGL